ncbi:MAG: DUF484 family protein [Gammaproteobacteria bacterium]|nr:DUF484 family protein [Gammaproteobacteria bacterium]
MTIETINDATEDGAIIEINKQQVIDYLNADEGFIRDNIEDLAELDIPHEAGVATSLIERQVAVLRKENSEIKAQLKKLIAIARDNEDLSHRIHQLFIEISHAESLDDLMATIQEQMQSFFNTDVVMFRYFSLLELRPIISDDLVFTLKNRQTTQLKKWLKQRTPACGALGDDVFAALFAKEKNIKSMAVIPLFGVKEYGTLLLGSSDAKRFSEEKGTVLLAQLGELVSSSLVKFIENQ